METFSKKTHGSMPLGKKKMMQTSALLTNLRIFVEAPAPVITFKTCSNPMFVQVKHRITMAQTVGQPQVTTRHNPTQLTKILEFPNCEEAKCNIPFKKYASAGEGLEVFSENVCVCGWVGVAFSKKNNPLPSNNPSHCLSFKMILDRFLNGAP